MKTASEIARYIVTFFQEREDPVANLKLQKLLYYVQGWHLAIYDAPAFGEDVEAWVHGPVVPIVYQIYRDYRWNPIVREVAPVDLGKDLKSVIDEVLEVYGPDTGWDLERRTHRETPWLTARGELPPDQASNIVISKEVISRYFKKLAARG